MIFLDTNVASQIISDSADTGVLAWLDALDADDVALTSVTAAELRLGAALVPPGRRKAKLQARVEQLIEVEFAGFVAPFDVGSSARYAEVVARRRTLGRPISTDDAQIAAICLQWGATLATRNVKDFKDTGVELANPWITG